MIIEARVYIGFRVDRAILHKWHFFILKNNSYELESYNLGFKDE